MTFNIKFFRYEKFVSGIRDFLECFKLGIKYSYLVESFLGRNYNGNCNLLYRVSHCMLTFEMHRKKSECIVRAMTKLLDDVPRETSSASLLKLIRFSLYSVLSAYSNFDETPDCTATWMKASIIYGKWTPSCPKLDHIRISLFPKLSSTSVLVNLIFATSCAKHRSLKIRAQNAATRCMMQLQVSNAKFIFIPFLFLLITYFCTRV